MIKFEPTPTIKRKAFSDRAVIGPLDDTLHIKSAAAAVVTAMNSIFALSVALLTRGGRNSSA